MFFKNRDIVVQYTTYENLILSLLFHINVSNIVT